MIVYLWARDKEISAIKRHQQNADIRSEPKLSSQCTLLRRHLIVDLRGTQFIHWTIPGWVCDRTALSVFVGATNTADHGFTNFPVSGLLNSEGSPVTELPPFCVAILLSSPLLCEHFTSKHQVWYSRSPLTAVEQIGRFTGRSLLSCKWTIKKTKVDP